MKLEMSTPAMPSAWLSNQQTCEVFMEQTLAISYHQNTNILINIIWPLLGSCCMFSESCIRVSRRVCDQHDYDVGKHAKRDAWVGVANSSKLETSSIPPYLNSNLFPPPHQFSTGLFPYTPCLSSPITHNDSPKAYTPRGWSQCSSAPTQSKFLKKTNDGKENEEILEWYATLGTEDLRELCKIRGRLHGGNRVQLIE